MSGLKVWVTVSSFAGDVYYIVPNNASEYLAELASQYNEDPEELKKRVLYIYIYLKIHVLDCSILSLCPIL